jgi:hypothetical protein
MSVSIGVRETRDVERKDAQSVVEGLLRGGVCWWVVEIRCEDELPYARESKMVRTGLKEWKVPNGRG